MTTLITPPEPQVTTQPATPDEEKAYAEALVSANASILNSGWKRFYASTSTQTLTSSWALQITLPHVANYVNQYKNLVWKIAITTASGDFTMVNARWIKWNTELKATLTSTDINDLELDYTINRRDRTILAGEQDVIEVSRMPHLKIAEDEDFGLYLREHQGAAKSMCLVTGFTRALNKGYA